MRLVAGLVAITVIFIFSGCSKSNSHPNGFMSATINGEAFNVENCSVLSTTAGGLQIAGFNRMYMGRSIQLAIRNYVDGATGTYTLTPLPDMTIWASVDTANSGTLAQSGTITIKSYSATVVSGTFSFNCVNGSIVTNVTNGVFEAKNE